MERNEEFYELSNIIDNCDSSYCDYVAEVLTDEGYRKEKYVAKEILCYLKATITDGLLKNHEILNALMKEYGVWVDE